MTEYLENEFPTEEGRYADGIEELHRLVVKSNRAEKFRLRQQLSYVVNDLAIIYKLMVAFQEPAYSLFSTW